MQFLERFVSLQGLPTFMCGLFSPIKSAVLSVTDTLRPTRNIELIHPCQLGLLCVNPLHDLTVEAVHILLRRFLLL